MFLVIIVFVKLLSLMTCLIKDILTYKKLVKTIDLINRYLMLIRYVMKGCAHALVSVKFKKSKFIQEKIRIFVQMTS